MSKDQRLHRSTCPYCGVGCGIEATTSKGQLIQTSGLGSHPANFGRLCVKGVNLPSTQSMTNRLLAPEVGGQIVSWETALTKVADGFAEIIDKHGPSAVALYLSGQLLTEDYYVANKLMKGFLGSGNVDTNSRLCMASAVAAHKRAFGEDVVPCDYTDLEKCDLLVLVGSNAAWTHPVLYQRIVAAREQRGTKVVVIDPRRTATCAIADLHLAIQPGSDAALFNALLCALESSGQINKDYLKAHTNGYSETLQIASKDAAAVSTITGLAEHELQEFFDCFSRHERVVTMYSQGINQSSSGTDKCNAIINCHLATGRINAEGMGPFSITGQPNAMGGREVGGMANQLAAHMDFTEQDVDRVATFWHAPQMARQPGRKAVDMFEDLHEGKIKAIWIMGTNPAVSLPQADRVKAALKACPLVVVSDTHRHTETAECADVLLPATPWGEKDGTVTNSERCISRQRALQAPSGSAKPDWKIVCEVAALLGHADAFKYAGPADIFREHAGLTQWANDAGRQFDLSSLSALTDREYDDLPPTQWPLNQRPFSNHHYATPDGRARLVPVEAVRPRQSKTERHPLVLNTGRLRDQWHTMTRTGLAPELFQHSPTPLIHAHPSDLHSLGVQEQSLVELKNDLGLIRAPIVADPQCQPGHLFAPIHWNEPFAWPMKVSSLCDAITDPFSGQPESKHIPVALTALKPAQWLSIATPVRLSPAALAPLYWSRRRFAQATSAEAIEGMNIALTSALSPEGITQWLRNEGISGIKLSYTDTTTYDQPNLRLMFFDHHHGVVCVMCGPEPIAMADAHALHQSAGSQANWRSVGGPDTLGCESGPMVCTCFEVSRAEVSREIAAGAASTDELGQRLRCGTNCGSCVPELKSLLDAAEGQGVRLSAKKQTTA